MAAPNPFRPGVGKAPPYLADREAQIERFRSYLRGFPENQRNIRITGLRGVGKTVLLKEYRKLALKEDWVVIKRDLSRRFQDEEQFATAVAADMQSALEELSTSAKAKRIAGNAAKAIGGLRLDVGGVGVTLPSGQAIAPPILEDRLRDALIELGKVAAKADRGVAFFYDEAHVVLDQPKKRQYPLSSLLAAFVEAQDHDDNLPVMLGVFGLQPLVSNLQAARSHSERLFKAELIDYVSFDAEEGQLSPAAKALVRPTVKTHISFDQKVAQDIARDVSGYPFFLQWFGEALWDVADEENEEVITRDLYERLRPSIQDGLDLEFFDGRYDETRRNEQATLRATASLGGESFRIADLFGVIPDKKQAAVQMSLNRLIGDNLIYRIRQGEYGYTAPLFGDYLRRRHPLTSD